MKPSNINDEQCRYFIYVRKSTTGEETQARSIGDQLAEIRELVAKQHLEVVGSFEESQSAKTKGRRHFNDMLARIEAGEADGIIAWHPDRLARNAFDGGQIIDLIDEGKIRDLKFCNFWFEPTAQGKLMLNLAFGQSKYYSDNLSVNIRRGQRQKTLEGVWAWRAPIGYLNDPLSRKIVPDPVRAPLIKKMFELYATGRYTFETLRDVVSAAGLSGDAKNTLSVSRHQDTLKNPFYYGMFILRGELHQGIHEPLVTKDLFDKVQQAMLRRSKPSPIRLKSYVYRGLLRCATCGCTITMETQKGHNYLRCTKRVIRDCPQPYAREEVVTEQIAQALTSVSLPDHWADWMIKQLNHDRTSGDTERAEGNRKLTTAVCKLDVKLDRLTAGYLDAGAFTAAEFCARKADLLGQKRKLLDDLAAMETEDVKRFEPVIRFVNGSKQRKYIAEARKLGELRATLEETGSNLPLDAKKLKWEPRGAWQLVVDQGRFAQPGTRAPDSGALVVGESNLITTECTEQESNLQPSG
jgi:site-specific DNA recombinase